jgi:hypothetical protein
VIAWLLRRNLWMIALVVIAFPSRAIELVSGLPPIPASESDVYLAAWLAAAAVMHRLNRRP